MRPASLRTGPSIADFRSNQLSLERVSGKITFGTVQEPRARAQAGTRRILGCNCHGVPVTSSGVCLAVPCDRRQREAILPREFTIGSLESPSCGIDSTSSEANYSFGPRRVVCDLIRTAVRLLARQSIGAQYDDVST